MKSHSEQLDDLQKLHQQISKEREFLKVDQAYLDNAPLALKEAVAPYVPETKIYEITW